MNQNFKTVLYGFAEFFLATLIATGVVGCIYLDVTIHHDLSEGSFVEFGQEALLWITTLVFGALAFKTRQGGLWLVAGFFCCLFIRELDAFFDEIAHGAWKYFALAIMILSLFKAWRLGIENTIATLAAFMKSRSFIFIFIGLLIVLVYSRLFGMGELWRTIMGDNYIRLVKNVVEEGSELWGYALIFWGALNFAFTSRK